MAEGAGPGCWGEEAAERAGEERAGGERAGR